jgi:signal peptidase I
MSTYTIEFMNIAPDTVEVRKAETTDIAGLVVPADAMQFGFYDNDRKWVAPFYYVTEEVDVGDLVELKARHPKASLHGDDVGADVFALVSWTYPEAERWNGKIIVPLNDDNVVVTRNGLVKIAKVGSRA